jgi:peroxiredoxin
MRAIDFQMPNLNRLRGSKRIHAVRQLDLTIRALPPASDGVKVVLATELADAADGSDRDTLQEVATTLADALGECPGQYAALSYLELAHLVRYEHLRVSLKDPGMAAAMAKLESEDRDIRQGDFALPDLQGKHWTLKDLRSQVVLVNFWEAGCLPCVQEIHALNALYRRFQKQGLVILAISDDDPTAMHSFAASHRVLYPVLLDPGRKVTDNFHVVAIPRTLAYDRAGALVAQTIGGRTRPQFEEMLGQAGLY